MSTFGWDTYIWDTSKADFSWLPVCRIINGVKAQKIALKDVRVVFLGAGSSAVGVAELIAALLQKEAGLSKKEAFEVSLAGFVAHTGSVYECHGRHGLKSASQ